MLNCWSWFGKGLVLVTALTGCDAVTDFFANQFFLPNENIRPSVYEVTTERRVAMKTRDEVTLRADVHHPNGIATTPTILVRIPFSLTIRESNAVGCDRALLGESGVYRRDSRDSRSV